MGRAVNIGNGKRGVHECNRAGNGNAQKKNLVIVPIEGRYPDLETGADTGRMESAYDGPDEMSNPQGKYLKKKDMTNHRQ